MRAPPPKSGQQKLSRPGAPLAHKCKSKPSPLLPQYSLSLGFPEISAPSLLPLRPTAASTTSYRQSVLQLGLDPFPNFINHQCPRATRPCRVPSSPRIACFHRPSTGVWKVFVLLRSDLTVRLGAPKPSGPAAPSACAPARAPTSLRRDGVAFGEMWVRTARPSSCCCLRLTAARSALVESGSPPPQPPSSLASPCAVAGGAPTEVGGFFRKGRGELLPQSPAPTARISAAKIYRPGKVWGRSAPPPNSQQKEEEKNTQQKGRSLVPPGF